MPLKECRYCSTTQTSDDCTNCSVSERASIQRLLDSLDNLTRLTQEYMGGDYDLPIPTTNKSENK